MRIRFERINLNSISNKEKIRYITDIYKKNDILVKRKIINTLRFALHSNKVRKSKNSTLNEFMKYIFIYCDSFQKNEIIYNLLQTIEK